MLDGCLIFGWAETVGELPFLEYDRLSAFSFQPHFFRPKNPKHRLCSTADGYQVETEYFIFSYQLVKIGHSTGAKPINIQEK